MARQLLDIKYPGLWPGDFTKGKTPMNTMLLKMYVKFQDLMNREEGQDLVEYALVVALIALGAAASMKVLATGISTAFTTISSNLAADL